MDASLCTFPAFSLGSTNAMVEKPARWPYLLPFEAMYPGQGGFVEPSEPYGSVGGMHLGSADMKYTAFRPCFSLISGVSNTGCLCLPFSVLVLWGSPLSAYKSDILDPRSGSLVNKKLVKEKQRWNTRTHGENGHLFALPTLSRVSRTNLARRPKWRPARGALAL